MWFMVLKRGDYNDYLQSEWAELVWREVITDQTDTAF